MNNKIKTIQVLGSGCPTCKQLFENVKKAAAELKIEAPVEYVTDVTKMIEMGVMSSPVLAVNGKPVLTGGGHNEKELKEALEKIIKKANSSGGCACSCGGC